MSRLERDSPCKVNLLLNILGKRPDGYHELETLMQPVALRDTLQVEPLPQPGIRLTCNLAALPTDSSNLVWRAAAAFFEQTRLSAGVRIHLEKRVPLAAGLGGGSSNAATTLMALNDLFERPLADPELSRLAAGLGSDVPFFLQSGPALATGRGEVVTPLAPFPVLRGAGILLIHPGFGVSTAWAYQALANFPEALHGERGRAQKVLQLLQGDSLEAAGQVFYNSLEAPVLRKYPILELYQKFLREAGAKAALMSGSGSTTFGIMASESAAQDVEERFRAHFGGSAWTAVTPL